MNQSCCNTCNTKAPELPLELNNRPGLNAVEYRIGTYGDFLQNLLEQLSLNENLKGLAVRDNSDFSIALLDAWSAAADVFTFYQERIANESYLRTVLERYSVLELARLVGYELKPGVAASTFIAFTLEKPQITLDSKAPTVNSTNLYGGALPAMIEKGIKIQSIPEQDQLPQVFETSSDIEARIEWNEIRPQLSLPQEALSDTVIFIKGVDKNIRKGDTLFIADKSGYSLKTVFEVIQQEEQTTTQLNLKSVVVVPNKSNLFFMPILTTDFIYQKQFNHAVSDTIKQLNYSQANLTVIKQINGWTDLEMKVGFNTPTPLPENNQVYIFRKKVAAFGFNATLNTKVKDGVTSQTVYNLDEQPGVLQLDNAYEEVLPDGYIAIQNPYNTAVPISYYKISKATTGVLTRYGVSSKTTTVSIVPADANSKSEWWGGGTNLDSIRQALILAQSEKLDLSNIPDTSLVEGDSITLDQYYPGLKENQVVSISGEKVDLPGILYYEIVFIKEVTVFAGKTVLRFVEALKNQYIRKTVFINANVVQATHGETVNEILGSGDASKPFQKFILKQPPLTFISANTPSGVSSSLEIRVNDLLWHEVDYFLDRAHDEHIFITRLDNAGNTTIIFGDGINGSRLPTGNNNVVASYRKGIGTSGLLKAKQLSQLATKPMQVKSAINPIPSSGAEDAETIDKARRNATLNILTLDRIVSLRDYEDFATAFAGIAKANAVWARRQNKQQIFLTIAGENGSEVDVNTHLYKNLVEAIGKAGINHTPINVSSYRPRFFNLSAGLVIHPDYVAAIVLEDARQRIINQFSFDQRGFMQPVLYSEVVTCLQETIGVEAVDIDSLARSEDSGTSIAYFLESSLPKITNDIFTSAELLTVAPEGISLKAIL